MMALLVVLAAALVAAAAASAAVLVTHGRLDPLDPQTEIRWLVRLLERRPRAMAFARRRLDRTTVSGFVLSMGLATVVLTALAVGALFEMFTRNALIARWDLGVAHWGATNVHDDNRNLLVRITDLGSTPVVATVTVAITLILLARRRWSSAGFLVAVVVGQLAINNLLKVLVGRERPNIDRLVPVSGYSFPSGHTVAAAATWSALALVFSSGATRRGRAIAAGFAAGIAGAVAATRAILGAHWLTDVLAGLAVGWGWFTLVAVLFGGRHQRAAAPLERAAHAPLPATAAAPTTTTPTTTPPRSGGARRALVTAGARTVAIALAAFLAVGTALGLLLTRVLDGSAFVDGDEAINRWFVRQRTPLMDSVSHVLSMLGNTETVIGLGLVAVVVMRLRWHRWNESMVLVVGLGLEVLSFLALANIVDRPRPDVDRLDPAPPTSSFPSGHTAAATVLFLGLGWIVIAHLRRDRRNRPACIAVGVLAGAIPVAVAFGRVYRGMHHPTDVVAGALLGLAALAVAIRVAMPSGVPSAVDVPEGAPSLDRAPAGPVTAGRDAAEVRRPAVPAG